MRFWFLLTFCIDKNDLQRKKTTILFRNCNLLPLELYNGPFQVYCTNTKGKAHQCIKGSAFNFIQQCILELHVYNETPNIVNFVLMSLTELTL